MEEKTGCSWVVRPIIATILLTATAGSAFGQEENGQLAIGVKSRFDWWETSKEKYDHKAFGEGYFESETIESKELDMGLLVGPELKYTYHKFFARGFFLSGSDGLSGGGDVEREYLGADIGYAKGIGAFIGYRRLDASFGGLGVASQIADHTISDAVLGLILQADQQTPGFTWGIEMVAGVRALFSAWDDDEYYKNPTILEAEATIGYKFKDIPLTANVGYGVWFYGKVARKYPYTPSLIIDEIVERWEDWGHGITLNVIYNF